MYYRPATAPIVNHGLVSWVYSAKALEAVSPNSEVLDAHHRAQACYGPRARHVADSGRCRSAFRSDADRESEVMPITIPG